MEPMSLLFSSYGLAFLFFFICILYIYYRFGCAPYTYFEKQGIPGPRPKPFIGNMDMLRKFEGNTIKMNSHIVKTYGPVAGIYMGTTPFLYLTDLDMVKEVMIKQFDKFVDRLDKAGGFRVRVEGEMYFSVFSSSADEWRKRRHFISPAFSARKMKSMECMIKKSTESLVRSVTTLSQGGQPVELTDLFSKMTMEIILSTAFGRSLDVQGGKGGALYESAHNLFKFFGGKTALPFRILQFALIAAPALAPVLFPLIRLLIGSSDPMPKLTEAAVKMIRMRSEENNSSAKQDLLQLLIDAKDSDGSKALQTGEIAADAVGFMFAGHETTAVALTLATYLLATHPDAQEKLANEILQYFEENQDKSMYDAAHELPYLDMVFNETLRLYPSAPSTARLCNQDTVVKGVHIRKGMTVFLPINDIHRDPQHWPEPEQFIPERFSPEEKANRHSCAYLPFGLGPRNCVGMRFAIMEAKMALIEMVKNFKIELAPETKMPVETTIEVTLKTKDKVFVNVQPRE